MRRIRLLSLAGLVALSLAIAFWAPGSASSVQDGPQNHVLARQLAIERGELKPTKFDKAMSGGVMSAVTAAFGSDGSAAPAAATRNGDNGSFAPPNRAGSQGCPNVFRANKGDDNGGGVDNIRVNQNCDLRRQAEETVAVNPTDFGNVLAGQNDSRIGFNHCGYDWSLDTGKTWGDTGTSPPPFWQTILDDGHTTDACSDPSATFDAEGNAYSTGVIFDVASPANGIFVAKSNAPIKGRFYHSPFPLTFQEYRDTPLGQVASDTDPNIAHDKELMIADSRATSPKKNRVYMTWTRFEINGVGPGGHSPIVFSQSVDGGANWSPAVVISGSSGAFCTVVSGTPDNPNACDQDQGSDPIIGPDGTIYVIFTNGNVPGAGVQQVLMVKCPATNECDSASDWLGPFRVGDEISTQPLGPSPAGCPAGRQCLPPNGYRAPDETTTSISVDKNGNLYATWADHRNNTNPDCELPTVGGSPPCDHDVFYAFSTDGGVTWSDTIDVTPRSRLGNTAQWQPWHDVAGDGSKVRVAFYDRHYGNCESTGCNDITLATITHPRTPNPTIRYRRITTSSMPNLTTANNPIQAGFLGDYMWVEVGRHNFNQKATHIVWADTRQLFGPAPEEDVYYARIPANDENGD